MKKLTIIAVSLVILTSCSSLPQQLSSSDQFDYLELTINKVHQALKQGQISCVQLVKRYLKRIETYDQSTQLNAIIHINPNALHKAKMLDKKFASTQRMRRLHCIPVILKDNFDTADMPTEAGSIALKGSIPPDDAFMVKRLRHEDAIIIAKSNMGEWAFSPYNTISSTHGETRNAYDLKRVPAGPVAVPPRLSPPILASSAWERIPAIPSAGRPHIYHWPGFDQPSAPPVETGLCHYYQTGISAVP